MSKHIFITGSTDGIGKLAALKLAKAGHHVYVHGRNAEKLHDTISDLKIQSDNENIIGYQADFSDISEVRNLGKKILDEVPQLNVLINNAGVFKSKIQQDDKGTDIRFTVNYLAPYVLSNLILPTLQATTNSRIINVSSAAQATVSLHALSGVSNLNDQEAYAQSKLALTMWNQHMSKQYPEVVSIAVNPGSLLNTKMVQEAYGKFWSSADKGANILYDLAVLEEYAERNGQYFDNDKGDPKGMFGEAHPDSKNEEKTNILLTTTEKILLKY